MIPFKKFSSDDREVALLQSNVDTALRQLQVQGLLNGLQLNDITLSTGDNTINHKLGRRINGYLISRKDSAALLYDKISTDSALDRSFTLNSSAPCTVSLWVY